MSTRAMVGIHNSDDTITYIYNHYDGYPTEVGLTLYQHYKPEKRVRELIAFGNTRRVEPVPFDMIGRLADTMETYRLGLMQRIGETAYKQLSDVYMEPLDGGAETVDNVTFFERLLDVGIDWLYMFDPTSTPASRWHVKSAGRAWIALPDAVRLYARSMAGKADRARLVERAAECGIEF